MGGISDVTEDSGVPEDDGEGVEATEDSESTRDHQDLELQGGGEEEPGVEDMPGEIIGKDKNPQYFILFSLKLYIYRILLPFRKRCFIFQHNEKHAFHYNNQNACPSKYALKNYFSFNYSKRIKLYPEHFNNFFSLQSGVHHAQWQSTLMVNFLQHVLFRQC